MNFLLIEDNETIRDGLMYAFKKKEYTLDIAINIKSASEKLNNNLYDLIILDIMLPDGNGLNFYKEQLQEKKIPVLFLTAIDDEDTIVDALSNAKTEYMTKPFSTKELMIRIERILKSKKDTIKIKNIEYNLNKMELKKDGTIINLSSLENNILYMLFTNAGKIVTRASILDKIWYLTGNDVDNHTITVYLKRIREKVGEDIIVTIKGIGYRIDIYDE